MPESDRMCKCYAVSLGRLRECCVKGVRDEGEREENLGKLWEPKSGPAAPKCGKLS